MKIIQTLEIIETQHFDTSNYITNRRSPSSKSNKWTITISVYFFNISLKYSWAKKIKLRNQNFCSPISLDVITSPSMEEFVHYS